MNTIANADISWATAAVSSRLHSMEVPLDERGSNWRSVQALVPLADLLNFAPIPNVACSSERSSRGDSDAHAAALVCRTLCAVAEGEELTTHYSSRDLSAREFLLD